MKQYLGMKLEAWLVERVCHHGKHLPHQLQVVGLVELGCKVTLCKVAQHILQKAWNTVVQWVRNCLVSHSVVVDKPLLLPQNACKDCE